MRSEGQMTRDRLISLNGPVALHTSTIRLNLLKVSTCSHLQAYLVLCLSTESNIACGPRSLLPLESSNIRQKAVR